jgi:hypothetical protein
VLVALWCVGTSRAVGAAGRSPVVLEVVCERRGTWVGLPSGLPPREDGAAGGVVARARGGTAPVAVVRETCVLTDGTLALAVSGRERTLRRLPSTVLAGAPPAVRGATAGGGAFAPDRSGAFTLTVLRIERSGRAWFISQGRLGAIRPGETVILSGWDGAGLLRNLGPSAALPPLTGGDGVAP